MFNKIKIKILSLIIAIVLCVILAISILFNLFSNNQNTVSEKDKKVVAKVEGKSIYRNEVDERLKTFADNANLDSEITLEQLPQNIIKAMVLEVYVNHKIDKLAKKDGYYKKDDIKKKIKKYKQNLAREAFIKNTIISGITEVELRSKYDELKKLLEGKEERKISHILLKTKEEAERIRRNIMRRGDFDKVAAANSLDKASALRGGDLGYILREEVVSEFSDVAFVLKKGKVSKPVETQYGWHIIKVDDIREAQPLEYSEVKSELKVKLQQDALQKYLSSLTKDVEVEVYIESEVKSNNSEDSIIEETLEEDAASETEEIKL